MNIVDHAANYGAYHADWRNIVIHTIFVPSITFCILVFLAYYPLPVDFDLNGNYVQMNWGLVALVAMTGGYALLNVDVALTFAFWATILWMYANHLVALFPETAWIYAIGLKVISWIFQFVGHGYYEGRRPALVDNVFLTLVAPLFVTLEVMFYLGWNPKLKKRIDTRIKAKLEVCKRK